MPEEKEVNKEQVARLLEKLAGHQGFARRRGTLGESFIELLCQLVNDAESPSEALRRWDELAADVRVMVNYLAVLQRDDEVSAMGELTAALRSPSFVFTGETVPVHETVPITILMFRPEETLLMLEWICCDHWMRLDQWIECKDGRKKPLYPMMERTDRLFAAFPLLERCVRERHVHEYEGRDLLDSRAALVEEFHRNLDPSLRGLRIRAGYNDHLEVSGFSGGEARFAFIAEAEQSEVLSLYSREQQLQIATWQLHVPRVVWESATTSGGLGYVIELHPELVHQDWLEKQPALTSRGVSHGYGARMETRLGTYLQQFGAGQEFGNHVFPLTR